MTDTINAMSVALTAESERVRVRLEMDSGLNYALVHNGVSPLRALSLENLTDEPLTGLGFELSFDGPLAGEIAAPRRGKLPDLAAREHREIEGRSVKIDFNHSTFGSIEEAIAGRVSMRVSHADGALTTNSDVRLLARDEWWALSLTELLAAFVVPRSKAIRDLLSEASDLLSERTGDSSLQGYQGGVDRAMRIAEAIYDAMRARRIRYINPPPSFEDTGQKIRSSHEVLVDRWGTCLDLATTYAAALETAGLNPVIVVCQGHAFTGHLSDEIQLPETVLRDKAMIETFVDSGQFVPIETVALCEAHGPDFRGASNRPAADGWWTHMLEEVDGLIDVRAAHRRVRPIPSVHIEDGVRVVEIERGVAPVAPAFEGKVEIRTTEEPEVRGGEREERTFPPRIERWRNSLLDLSFRNPLLNMKSGRGALDLHVPKDALPSLEDLIFDGRPVNIAPHDALAEIHIARGARSAQDIDADELKQLLVVEKSVFGAVPQSSYTSRLRGLQRRARTIFEETGANNLFLALGVLRWEDAGRKARAPLFLVPVHLIARRGRPFQMQIDDGGFAQPNQCLLEKLRVSRGVEIPEFEDPEKDESGIDLGRSLQAIRLGMIDAGLPFAVEETAHLAILEFSTLQLWQDLTENWETFLRNPVVRHMVETPTDSFVDSDGDPAEGLDAAAESDSYCPIAIDGSQLEAVTWAEAGRSFVLEGPPGTGKSQTITNLIANALAVGQKVLFVAEKQAALDVVRRRLDAIGLGALCLDLHGKQQSPQGVRAQLREALHLRTDGNPGSWEALRSRHRLAVETLGRYPGALHDRGTCGLSLWAAQQTLLTLGEGPAVAVEPGIVSQDLDPEELYRRARDLSERLLALSTAVDRHPWGLSGICSETGFLDRSGLQQAVEELASALASIGRDAALDRLLVAVEDPRGLDLVTQWIEAASSEAAAPDPDEAVALQSDAHQASLDSSRRKIRALGEDATSLMSTFSPSAMTNADLGALLIQSKAADSKLFKGRARKAIANELAGVATDGQQIDRKTLTPSLEALVDLRTRVRSIRDELGALPGIDLEASWNPLTPDDIAALERRVELLAFSAQLAGRSPEAAAAIDGLTRDGGLEEKLSLATGLAAAWRSLLERLKSSEVRLAAWLRGRSPYSALRDDFPTWERDARDCAFVELGRWVAVAEALATFSDEGLVELVGAVLSGGLYPEAIEPALRRGFATAVITERLSRPPLAGFDGIARDRSVAQFTSGAAELREEMVSELPALVARRRPFDPERMVGKVGELSRELGRKRGGLKVRELFATYGPTITELTPCLMMSPHTAARFLPPDAAEIDLVVFDEASQIKVAESISAMGRGKAVVVVGDSQQMPPSSAFSGGVEEEDDRPAFVGIPADMESVLSEAVESNLPRVWLSWHYRSKHEALIAFSNVHYYEGRLASFPRPPADIGEFGVSLRQVNGVWERGGAGVNRAEADAIVGEVQRRLASGEPPSIGVVTLNSNQRDLIMDMLEESTDERIAAALELNEEGLFVKNLENVQGDERDVILFSLAFSPDPETGRLRLNFGPLTQAGGERRLNVAVTRARAQVILFASFEPHHIDLARTSSVGLAHLRSYLEMARRDGDQVGTVSAARARDRHRDEVVDALRADGLEVTSEIGLSDFKIDIGAAPGPHGPWTAVLLDGPEYASRRTVNDREGLPTTVLAGPMGWAEIARIWLPDWIRDRDEVVRRVVGRVRGASAPVSPANEPAMHQDHPPAPEEQPGETFRDLGTDGVGPEEQAQSHIPSHEPPPSSRFADLHEFVPAHVDAVGSRELLDQLDFAKYARAAVANEVDDVIDAEAPIEAGRLARIVARRFDLSRVSESRTASILALVPPEQIHSSKFGHFVWPLGVNPSEWRTFRKADSEGSRATDEVAPEEIVNAMVYLAEVGAGISREELIRELGLIFGIRRVTQRIEELIEGIVDEALLSDRLAESNGSIEPR